MDHQNIYHNIESAKKFLALFEHEPNFFKMLYELFDSISLRTENFQADEISAIILLDDALQNDLNKKENAFIILASSMNARIELSKQGILLVHFFDTISKIYQKILIQLAAQGKNPFFILLTSRVMFNTTRLIKWGLFNRSTTDKQILLRFNQAYLLAEKYNITTLPVSPYPLTETTTLQDLFIQGHMLSLADSGYFNPSEINFIYDFLQKYSNRIQVLDQYINTRCFVVTINTAKTVRLYLKDAANEYDRFWSMEPITKILNQWRVHHLMGTMPEKLLDDKKIKLNPNFINKLFKIWTEIDLKMSAQTYLEKPAEIFCISGFNGILKHFKGSAKIPNKQTLSIQKLSLESLETERNVEQIPSELLETPFPAEVLSISSKEMNIVYDLTNNTASNLIYSLIFWQEVQKDNMIKSGVGFLDRILRRGETQIESSIVKLGQRPVPTMMSLLEDNIMRAQPSTSLKNYDILLCRYMDKKVQRYCIISNHHFNKDQKWGIKLASRTFATQIKDIKYSGQGWYCIEIDILSEITSIKKISL